MQLRNTALFIRYAHACRTRYVGLSTEQWVLFHPTGKQANADCDQNNYSSACLSYLSRSSVCHVDYNLSNKEFGFASLQYVDICGGSVTG